MVSGCRYELDDFERSVILSLPPNNLPDGRVAMIGDCEKVFCVGSEPALLEQMPAWKCRRYSWI